MVSGYAEGESELNAFDNSLLKAGIGNTNLIRISSILPPNSHESKQLNLPPGALVPVAYASEISGLAGARVAASVTCGIPQDSSLPGVIMEHHMVGNEAECRAASIRKVEAAFRTRGWVLAEMKTASAGGVVRQIGCAFAGVALWT